MKPVLTDRTQKPTGHFWGGVRMNILMKITHIRTCPHFLDSLELEHIPKLLC
jgi:hypothetical protein